MTTFITLDLDSSYNIVVGGSSSDSSITYSSGTQPLLVFYWGNATLRWSNYYTVTGGTQTSYVISAVKFTSSQTIAMAF